jgi:hypothetical protein
MSPIPMATREPSGSRPAPIIPLPSMDVVREMAKEIVVDWQLPSDMEHKG